MDKAGLTNKRPKQFPWVIPPFCDGCTSCVNACPQKQLHMVETGLAGVFVPWLGAPARCIGCGKCADACAMGAIVMTAYVDEAIQRFIEKRP